MGSRAANSSKALKWVLAGCVWLASLMLAFQMGNRSPAGEEWGQDSRGALDSSRHLRRTIVTGVSPEKSATDDPDFFRQAEAVEFLDIVSAATIDGGDPEDAFMDALGMDSPRKRQVALETIAGRLQETGVRSTLARLGRQPPGSTRNAAQSALMRRWGELNPESAFRYAGGVAQPKLRHDLKLNVYRGWARVDPDGAWSRANDNRIPHQPSDRFDAIFEALPYSDTSSALNFLSGVDAKYHYSRVAHAISGLAGSDMNRVVEWTGQLPQGGLRRVAVCKLIDHWARYDPLSAKVWMEENVGNSNLPEARVELGESWARVDPSDAVKWVMKLDGSDAKNSRVMDRVFKRWLQYDPDNAANWLVDQEPSRLLDPAVERYIHKVVRLDPEATMPWAESITHPSRRANLIQQVAHFWKSRNPEAMAEYVSNSSFLSRESKERLMRPQSRGSEGSHGRDRHPGNDR